MLHDGYSLKKINDCLGIKITTLYQHLGEMRKAREIRTDLDRLMA